MSVNYDILKNKILKVFSNPDGRYVLRWILGICGLYEDSFTGNSQTFYREGRRSVGLEILEEINKADKEIFIKTLREEVDDE